ncbi:cupin domain-containing protein [Paucibacter sp. B2R-40]|uniref:cupin domain-containing protein n=1 Tax=Paucibacter sp. B2R-40 TaxID=2893554 RepID=UPI0021E3E864|nr:cupin domain-containing protein [Paucibacter sp. B2R-40]MCV2356074.1 cupin domain-containing protein [Paucibacter sp. B2R-40]
MHAVNLKLTLASVTEPWRPSTVAHFNGNEVMVAKGRGSYPWHKHEESDDLFLVLQGRLMLELRDRQIHLAAGEMFVVPKGVEHRPVVAEGEEAHFMLIEPPGTAKSGTTLVE